MFNNTNQYISYVEHYPKVQTNQAAMVCMLNFVFEVEKKNVDINSTIWESSDGKSYIKILYNNSGVIYRLNENEQEIIVNISSLLNKKTTLSIRLLHSFTGLAYVIIYLNGNNI